MPITEVPVSRRDALALAGAGVAAAITLPGTAFGQTGGSRVTILHGGGAVQLGWVPSYLAEALGYYKDEGLTVERILNGSGPAGFTALVSGSGHALVTAPGELIVGVARGQKFKALFAQSNYQPAHLAVSKAFAAKHGITTTMTYEQKLAAFRRGKGIRIGISTPGSLTDLVARSALTKAGLDPVSDAQIVPLGSVPNALAALGSDRIDAFTGAAPAPQLAVSQFGAVMMFSVGKDEFPGLKAMAGVVTEARATDVEQHPDLYAALVRADTRALRYIVENPDKAGELMHRTYFTSTPDDAWELAWSGNVSQFQSPYVFKEALAAWIQAGAIPGITDPNTVPLDDVPDMRFVDAALKKIGWRVPT